MNNQLLEVTKSNAAVVAFITDISTILSNPMIQWEHAVEHALSKIGSLLKIDQIESVIKSQDKRQSIFSWSLYEHTHTSNVIKEESDFISFLFKNREENLFYFQELNPKSPPQIKKILHFKRLKSAVVLNLQYRSKKLGYITFGNIDESRRLDQEELQIIRSFGRMLSNFIANQHQAQMIKQLVGKNSEQDRRIKEFTFITSHHLRAFSSNLASLTEYMLVNPSEQRFIEMISNSVKKLNGSIRDINEILTEENDLLTEEISRVKVSSVINKVVKWHKKAIDAGEIEIENLLSKKLTIYSQQEMLENIFSHIFSNALKYGVNQDAKLIRIDYTKNEDYLIVRIRDFGEGINMKKYGHKLFKAGSRFNKDSNSSLGMGLFLSKYQIQKIGGRIHLKSEPGKGTSVQCYLPVGKTL